MVLQMTPKKKFSEVISGDPTYRERPKPVSCQAITMANTNTLMSMKQHNIVINYKTVILLRLLFFQRPSVLIFRFLVDIEMNQLVDVSRK